MSAVLRDEPARLRPMRSQDVARVLATECEAYEFPWTGRIFHDCLRVGYSCWVVEQGADLVGHGILQVAAGESHILNLCVGPRWRRRGHGRALLGRLVEVARDHNAGVCLLEVRPSNRHAIALYRDAGFEQVGARTAYYPGRHGREDALVYSLAL